MDRVLGHTSLGLACCAGTSQLEPRLLGGRADPNGAWAYGRLEVFDRDSGFFSSVRETLVRQQLGRRGVEVACRTLGFATGAQLLSGAGSGLPGSDGTLNTLSATITCLDDAVTLADCTAEEEDAFRVYEELQFEEGDTAVALLCYNPTGVFCLPCT